MSEEYNLILARLQCQLEDNNLILNKLNKDIKCNIDYDLKNNGIEKSNSLESDIIRYGSKETKELYKTLICVDAIRNPLSEAIFYMKKVIKYEEEMI